jgi:hypothetical protein
MAASLDAMRRPKKVGSSSRGLRWRRRRERVGHAVVTGVCLATSPRWGILKRATKRATEGEEK